MQLNLETDYAIRCLLVLGTDYDPDRYISAATLSKDVAITPGHVQKILRNLKAAGFIKRKMGVTGGYALKDSPDSIYILDVIEKMDGTIAINRCLEPDNYCNRDAVGNCNMHEFYLYMQETLINFFGRVTLLDIIDRTFKDPAFRRTKK